MLKAVPVSASLRSMLEGTKATPSDVPLAYGQDGGLLRSPAALLAVQYRMYQKMICWDLLLEVSREVLARTAEST